MTYQRFKLGTLAHFVNGKAFQPSDWSTCGIPIIRIQNLNNPDRTFNYWAGPLDRQVQVKKDDLLLAWSGTPGTSFGAFIWSGTDAVLNQHIFRVDLDTKQIIITWAKFVINFQLERLIDLAHGGVGLKHVTRSMVEELEVPVPPLAEQWRITEVLSRADSLRTKSRSAISQLGTLAQAIFLDMFGDPVTNPKGWRCVPFEELLSSIESGRSPNCLDRPATGEEWGVLKLGAVTWCEYDPTENKALPPGILPGKNHEVKTGDLLFTRKNTYELVAACAFVHETPPRLLLPDLIFRFQLKHDAPIDPIYLHQLIINPAKRREIQKLAGGSAGSMPNISKSRLKETLIEVPPVQLQHEFARRIEVVEKVKNYHRSLFTEIEALFASLQNSAFKGEL